MKILIALLFCLGTWLGAQTVETIHTNPRTGTTTNCGGSPNIQYNDVNGTLWGCKPGTGWATLGGYVYVGALSGIPATCVVGQISFITDATAGQNQYNCTTTNVWTQSGGGGASPAGPTNCIQVTDGATPAHLVCNGPTIDGSGNIAGTSLTVTGSVTTGSAGGVRGQAGLAGATAGVVTVQPGSDNFTSFNYNLPVTAGTAGYFQTSQGGGATAMTWTTPVMTGDVTTTFPAVTVSAIGGKAVSLANSLTTSGNFAATLTLTAASNSTLPAGTQTLVGGGDALTTANCFVIQNATTNGLVRCLPSVGYNNNTNSPRITVGTGSGSGVLDVDSSNVVKGEINGGTSGVEFESFNTGGFAFSSDATGNGAVDTNMTRCAAGIACFGTGAQGNAGGTAKATNLWAVAVAVASLPSCAAGTLGYRATVNDSNAVSFTAGIGAVVAAGGSTIVPVFCDGTNWRIG